MNKYLKIKLLLLFIIVSTGIQAQPFTNLEHFDYKRVQFGYYFGTNMLDFKINYRNLDYTAPLTTEISVDKRYGFNVGVSTDFRIMNHLNLRIEPGLISNRRMLIFPGINGNEKDYKREVSSTYIYIPLLLKFSSQRWYNFKPYITTGVSATINLSSYENLNIDNQEGRFRMKKNVFFYELGLGFDIYTPYFRLSPSIRGLFSFRDDLVPDRDTNSPWTGNLKGIQTRGFLINLTFE